MNTTPYNPSVFVPAAAPVPQGEPAEVQALRDVMSFLEAKDQTFAKSLLDFGDKNRFLSEKQLYWVGELARRGTARKTAPAPVKQDLGTGFLRIAKLFDRANAAGIMNPKIRLETESGQKVVLRRLSSGRNPGSISVTDAGRSFNTRIYFGRVDQEGQFFPPTQGTDPVQLMNVAQLLRDMANDPAKVAALYGHRHSSCCFCGLELKTRESVAVGYGPICAEKYGLPWGEVAPPTYTKITTHDNEGETDG